MAIRVPPVDAGADELGIEERFFDERAPDGVEQQNVRAGLGRQMQVRFPGDLRPSRIDHDEARPPPGSLPNSGADDGMTLGHVGADDKGRGVSKPVEDEVEQLRKQLEDTSGDPVLRILAHAVLMLVDVTDRLADEVGELNEHAAKTAGCLDYLTDHLHEVGQPA